MATETPSISRQTAATASTDYKRLLELGIQHIESMSGKIWTDYNAHDPGITILEVLCYAITELGYRCDYDVKDLLTPPPGGNIVQQFSGLAASASNAPLTINDFRKVLIDLDQVRNAWIERVEIVSANTGECQKPTPAPVSNGSTGTPSPNPNTGTSTQANPNTGTFTQANPITGSNANGNSSQSASEFNEAANEVGNGLQSRFSFVNQALLSVDSENPSANTLGTDPNMPLGLIPLFLDPENDLFYNSQSTLNTRKKVLVKGLYNVFLHFDEDPRLGNLNDNTVEEVLKIEPIGYEAPLPFFVEMEFPAYADVPRELDDILADFDAQQLEVDPVFPFEAEKEIFTVDLGSISEVEGFDFVYDLKLVIIKHGGASFPLPVRLRVISGQEFVINREEFALKLAAEFQKTASLLPSATETTTTYFGGKYDFAHYREIVGIVTRYILRRAEIANLLGECRKVLAGYRNLCEDFVGVYPMSQQEIGLDVEVEISLDSVPEQVMAEIFYRTEVLLSPKIQVYSLREMLDKGYSPEEIFRGPWLNNGFIDANEKAFQVQEKVVFTSDLLQEYMKIPGVLSVKKLELTHFVMGKPPVKGLADCLYLENPARFIPNLNYARSSIKVSTGQASEIRPDLLTAKDILRQLKAVNQLNGSTGQGDFDIPQGEFADAARYFSIQNEFPAIYGIGQEGLSESEPAHRKAQAAQLKGYLMFFDQLLANFLSQLAHVRELFSTSDTVERTYFTQALFDVPGVRKLLKGFTGTTEALWQDFIQPGNPNNHYINRLNALSENEAIFQDRRKRFLDHLLGRFNESFTDYAAYVFSRKGNKSDQYKDVIGHQARFLNNYNDHAMHRAQAWNYLFPSAGTWAGEEQLTGLKRRIVHAAGLPELGFGLRGPELRFINPFDTMEFTDENQGSFSHHKYRFKTQADVVFARIKAGTSTNPWPRSLAAAREHAVAALEKVLTWKENDPYPVVLEQDFVDEFTNVDEAWLEARRRLIEIYSVENLYIVEHILLRQRNSGEQTLRARIYRRTATGKACDAVNVEDPYSFRISVVLPTWAGRFRDQDYRKVFKKLIRLECPAHVYIHFVWLDPAQMYFFENTWQAWTSGTEWDSDIARLLWENSDLQVNPNHGWLTQENKFSLLLEQQSATSMDGFTMIDCMNMLKNRLEARYEFNPRKILLEYELCETIGKPVDPDGEITFARVMTGTLPKGVCMDECTGEIKVDNLIEFNKNNYKGTWPLEIVTVNSAGEETWHSFTISFVANGPAVLKPGYPLNQHIAKYQDNDVLAEFVETDVDENNVPIPIVKAVLLGVVFPTGYQQTIAPGLGPVMPKGMLLDSISGQITVGNASDLRPGDYTLSLVLSDNQFGVTKISVLIKIIPDTAAVFTLSPNYTPSSNEDKYDTQFIFGQLTDIDDGLAEAVGASFANPLDTYSLELVPTTATGTGKPAFNLRISDPDKFRSDLSKWPTTLEGGFTIYRREFTFRTKDHCGGTSTLTQVLKIRKDNTPVFQHSTVKGASFIAPGEMIAYIKDEVDGGINFITSPETSFLAGIGVTVVYEPLTAGGPTKVAKFKVATPGPFLAYINGQTGDSANVVSIPITVFAKDMSGGTHTFTSVSLKSKKDNPPVVDPADVRNIDSYLQGQVLITVTDPDNHIVAASHQGGVNLFNIGVTMEAPMSSVPSEGMLLRAANIVHVNTNDVKLRITNLTKFILAVTGNTYFTVLNSNLGIVRASFMLRTVDGLGGVATTQINIDVRRDIETTAIPLKNNLPINKYEKDDIVMRLVVGDVGAEFESVVLKYFVPTTTTPETDTSTGGSALRSFASGGSIGVRPTVLPPGLSGSITGGYYDIKVSNKDALVAGSTAITADTEDSTGGLSSVDFTIVFQARQFDMEFLLVPVRAGAGHPLNLATKEAGLKITSLTPSNGNLGTFGVLLLGNGIQPTFTEGSSFATSPKPAILNYVGVNTLTLKPVQGKLSIWRSVSPKGDTVKTETGNDFRITSPSLVGEFDLEGSKSAANKVTTTESRNLVLNLGRVNAGASEETTEAFKRGAKDPEVAEAFENLLTKTADAIVETQKLIETATGQELVDAREELRAYVGNFKDLVEAAVNFAGETKDEDLSGDDAMSKIFDIVKEQMGRMQ